MAKYEHFELLELADGVFAAIATPLGAAFCNAGIIDLGGTTLVFDSFDVPLPAVDLREAVEHLTGRAAKYLIVSHWHGDHWGGSQEFSDAIMVSTRACHQQMSRMVKDIQAVAADPSELKEMLHQLEQAREKETDPAQKDVYKRRIVRMRYTLDSLPTFQIHLPSQTFEGEVNFHGTRRSARLVAAGHAHSNGDAYLVLPEDQIVFCGDLLFSGRQPYMGTSSLRTWKQQLNALIRLQAKVYIPGHGPASSIEGLSLEKAYLDWAEAAVVEIKRSGKPLEDALNLALPDTFAIWPDRTRLAEGNARRLYERAKKSSN